VRNDKSNDPRNLLHEYDQPQNTAWITVKYGIHLIYLRVTSFNNEVSLFSAFFNCGGVKTDHCRNWLE